MPVERLALGDPAAVAARVRALTPGAASVSEVVARIVADVRARGDAALLEYARRFDGVEAPLRVAPHELAAARAALDQDVADGLLIASVNVEKVAEAWLREDADVTLVQGHVVRQREVPVRRAAVYVPGGRAPYPSSVIMGVATARAAGVGEVVVCSPGAHPLILAACRIHSGVDEVYRMGGAHAIAALAYGTETIPRVDVIVGPGNLYVQEAKRLVSGDVGIDGFAGPSDVLVLASAGADPRLVAMDLAAQAEHGDGTIVCAVSDDAALLDAIAAGLGGGGAAELGGGGAAELGGAGAAELGGASAAAALVDAPDLEAALAFAEAFAPEHLELVGAGAEALAPRVRSAGCVFVGREGATAYGDYVAGSNHTLPTGGAARFASGLNVGHFRRRMSEVHIGGAAAALAAAGAPIARAEGFDRHAASMELRKNPAP